MEHQALTSSKPSHHQATKPSSPQPTEQPPIISKPKEPDHKPLQCQNQSHHQACHNPTQNRTTTKAFTIARTSPSSSSQHQTPTKAGVQQSTPPQTLITETHLANKHHVQNHPNPNHRNPTEPLVHHAQATTKIKPSFHHHPTFPKPTISTIKIPKSIGDKSTQIDIMGEM